MWFTKQQINYQIKMDSESSTDFNLYNSQQGGYFRRSDDFEVKFLSILRLLEGLFCFVKITNRYKRHRDSRSNRNIGISHVILYTKFACVMWRLLWYKMRSEMFVGCCNDSDHTLKTFHGHCLHQLTWIWRRRHCSVMKWSWIHIPTPGLELFTSSSASMGKTANVREPPFFQLLNRKF